jgi:hypothetical protein
MRICCSLPVALSLAENINNAVSKVTSICGMPRGSGGIPTKSNWPSNLLSAASSRSPWRRRIVTAPWSSSAVEKIWLRLVGRGRSLPRRRSPTRLYPARSAFCRRGIWRCPVATVTGRSTLIRLLDRVELPTSPRSSRPCLYRDRSRERVQRHVATRKRRPPINLAHFYTRRVQSQLLAALFFG